MTEGALELLHSWVEQDRGFRQYEIKWLGPMWQRSNRYSGGYQVSIWSKRQPVKDPALQAYRGKYERVTRHSWNLYQAVTFCVDMYQARLKHNKKTKSTIV